MSLSTFLLNFLCAKEGRIRALESDRHKTHFPLYRGLNSNKSLTQAMSQVGYLSYTPAQYLQPVISCFSIIST